MTWYSVQPRDIIFVKGYGLFLSAQNMGKIIGKNISNSLNSKYTPKLLDHVKQSAADAFKTSPKRVIQKTAEKKLKKHLYIIYIHGTKTKNYWWSKIKIRLIRYIIMGYRKIINLLDDTTTI